MGGNQLHVANNSSHFNNSNCGNHISYNMSSPMMNNKFIRAMDTPSANKFGHIL